MKWNLRLVLGIITFVYTLFHWLIGRNDCEINWYDKNHYLRILSYGSLSVHDHVEKWQVGGPLFSTGVLSHEDETHHAVHHGYLRWLSSKALDLR